VSPALEQAFSRVARKMGKLRAENERLRTACEKLGPWMSAALDDPQVCAEMKDAIKAWFSALEEAEKAEGAEFERQMTIARRVMKKDRNALREFAKR
jgi:hypothetical protein